MVTANERRATLGSGGRGDSGVTLTELLVAASLLMVVVIGGYLLLEAVTGMVDLTEARTRAQEDTRAAMDRITGEVRQAAELPGAEDTGVFSVATTSTITFYSDVDHDMLLERVSYRRDGSRLLRSVAESAIVNGSYSFASPGPEAPILTGLPADWGQPIFRIWAHGSTSVEATGVVTASALSIHLRDGVTVGRSTGFADNETWIKVRSIYNAVK